MLTIGTARGTVEIGLATTTDDFDQAFRLVHDTYVARGYQRPAATGRRLTLYQAMPSTKVFVARMAGRVVATLSLVGDSTLKLPCDDLYRDELAAMRVTGRRLAEVSALAVADDWRGARLECFRALVQAVGVYARRIAAVDDLCITVHPRHAPFYEALLRFERFGGLKSYDSVNGAPAVGLRLDLRRELAHVPDAAALPFAAPLFHPDAVARVLASLERDVACSVITPARFAHLFLGIEGDVEPLPDPRLQFLQSRARRAPAMVP